VRLVVLGLLMCVATGCYDIVAADGGAWRINKVTGTVSVCNATMRSFACKPLNEIPADEKFRRLDDPVNK